MEPVYLSTLSSKGQLTFPKDLREALKLEKGAFVMMKPVAGGVLLKKAEIKPTEDELSDEEWETLAEMASQKGRRYASGKKFLQSLK